MTKLSAIKSRLAAATPGPWDRPVIHDGEPMRVITSGGNIVFGMGGFSGSDFVPEQDEANATLMQHAPSDLSWLIARVERLEKALRTIDADADRGFVVCGACFNETACFDCDSRLTCRRALDEEDSES